MRIYTKAMCQQVEKLGEKYINKGDYESALFEFRRARGRYATLIDRNINVADDLVRCDYFIDYLDGLADYRAVL